MQRIENKELLENKKPPIGSGSALRANGAKRFDAIILGAGASGLFCALRAGKKGRKVLLLDHSDAPGKKILISGGGRCNFTNTAAASSHYLSRYPEFTKSALARFTPKNFLELLDAHRIPYEEKNPGQLFCKNGSRDILKMLLAEAESAGVELLKGTVVSSVSKSDLFSVVTNRGCFESRALVVATGGLSYPKAGASDFAYRIAEQFAIPRTPCRPGLVGLRFSPSFLARFPALSGVSFFAETRCGKTSFRENILFTHSGLSGPAILQISSYATGDSPISIHLLPRLDLASWLAEDPGIPLVKRLARILPTRFAEAWCNAHAPRRPLSQCTKNEIRSVEENLSAWTPSFSGTEGFSRAEVTVGGIDTKHLSSKTMEARSCPGLYFIGECQDVTGWLGGYNLQWAWSSGAAAGDSL